MKSIKLEDLVVKTFVTTIDHTQLHVIKSGSAIGPLACGGDDPNTELPVPVDVTQAQTLALCEPDC